MKIIFAFTEYPVKFEYYKLKHFALWNKKKVNR